MVDLVNIVLFLQIPFERCDSGQNILHSSANKDQIHGAWYSET